MKIDKDLLPDNWEDFTPEEKEEYENLTPEEKAFYKIMMLDQRDKRQLRS